MIEPTGRQQLRRHQKDEKSQQVRKAQYVQRKSADFNRWLVRWNAGYAEKQPVNAFKGSSREGSHC